MKVLELDSSVKLHKCPSGLGTCLVYILEWDGMSVDLVDTSSTPLLPPLDEIE